jgi:hypothetical protein
MEMINEAFWLHKVQIQSFILCSGDPYKFPTQMSNGLPIWNHQQLNWKPSLLRLGWRLLTIGVKPFYPFLQIMHLLKFPYP